MRTKHTESYPADFESLKAWRESLGLTQMEAAAILRMAQKSYSRYETGERFMKGPLLGRVYRRTKVRLDALTGMNTASPKRPMKTAAATEVIRISE